MSLACPELILEGQAYKLLSEWWSCRHPVRAVVQGCHCRVTIIIEPLGIPIVGTIGDAPMTECERDILDVLRASETPLTRPKIIDALEEAGKIHGESTIAHALARMVKAKIISNLGGRLGYSASNQDI